MKPSIMMEKMRQSLGFGKKSVSKEEPKPDAPIFPGDHRRLSFIDEKERAILSKMFSEGTKKSLIKLAQSTPLSKLDGSPNPGWVTTFRIAFPMLTDNEIRQKQLDLMAEELQIIEAFLNKDVNAPVDDWTQGIDPEIAVDGMGLLHIRVGCNWERYSPADTMDIYSSILKNNGQ